jgi:hypothetical protein
MGVKRGSWEEVVKREKWFCLPGRLMGFGDVRDVKSDCCDERSVHAPQTDWLNPYAFFPSGLAFENHIPCLPYETRRLSITLRYRRRLANVQGCEQSTGF